MIPVIPELGNRLIYHRDGDPIPDGYVRVTQGQAQDMADGYAFLKKHRLIMSLLDEMKPGTVPIWQLMMTPPEDFEDFIEGVTEYMEDFKSKCDGHLAAQRMMPLFAGGVEGPAPKPKQDDEIKKWDIWIEGVHNKGGEISKAALVQARVPAKDFKQACINWFGVRDTAFDAHTLSYEGRRLYDNERQARRVFG